jgi:hypothetical protein
MRLGCTGCLAALLGVALGVVVLGGAVGVGLRVLASPDPEGSRHAEASAADGTRAQKKLFGLARGDRRGGPVTLTEAEVNALLARHLVDPGGRQLSGLQARLLGDDRVQLRGQTPLARLLDEIGLGPAGGTLPARWQTRPVYLLASGRLSVEDGAKRHLRFEIEEFRLGRQVLPTSALRMLVDPSTIGWLRWRLPEHVEAVAVEPGRVLIRTAP